jgi:hypothetical protein
VISLLVHLVHWLSGVIVLAEALNKLERTAPLRSGMTPRERAVEWLKAIAWALLAMGGAGALITPLLPLETPTLQDMCVLLGFAVLIVRTRIKEG